MPKRYISYKKDDLLEKIYKIVRASENAIYRRDCNEMILYFVRNGYLPTSMRKRASEIVGIEIPDGPKPPVESRRYLYAIQASDKVKIGYSANPKSRMRSLQTASTDKLSLVWQCYVGDDDKEAKRQEKKLHRMISHFRIRGEWFKLECLVAVRGYRVKNYYTKVEKKADEINSSLDSEYSAVMANL